MAEFEIDLKLEGAAELNRKLNRLSQSKIDQIALTAVQVAAYPLANQMRALVPVRTGRLRGSIDAETRHYKGVAYAIVGPRAEFNDLAYVVEEGSGPRYTKRGGRYSGSMPAQPFVSPVFEQNKTHMQEVVSGFVAAAVEREAAR